MGGNLLKGERMPMVTIKGGKTVIEEQRPGDLEEIRAALERSGFVIADAICGHEDDIAVILVPSANKRNAGRKRKYLPLDSPLRGMSDEERAEWIEAHSEEEGMAALGVGRSAYFRRKAELRAAVGGE